MMGSHHKDTVITTFRLASARHRELRVAVASRGISMQRALEEAIARWLREGAHAAPAETGASLKGILRGTRVMELRQHERRAEMKRDARKTRS
jgi:hypothetical protein